MTGEEMAVKLAETEARSKSNTHRIDKLEQSTEAINRLATSVEVMATKQDTMNDNLDKIAGKVEQIEAEPGKRWKSVVEKVTLLVVAAVVGYILARVGL
ncbi:hypothetical protein ACTQ4E_08795 [Lawsonibacter sp. LCP25S3_G6]|uniref:hypothetical protein n=1 Tax=unclassified Lawsonibacter TaxID=2617946 RepID=UPI003F9B6413